MALPDPRQALGPSTSTWSCRRSWSRWPKNSGRARRRSFGKVPFPRSWANRPCSLPSSPICCPMRSSSLPRERFREWFFDRRRGRERCGCGSKTMGSGSPPSITLGSSAFSSASIGWRTIRGPAWGWRRSPVPPNGWEGASAWTPRRPGAAASGSNLRSRHRLQQPERVQSPSSGNPRGGASRHVRLGNRTEEVPIRFLTVLKPTPIQECSISVILRRYHPFVSDLIRTIAFMALVLPAGAQESGDLLKSGVAKIKSGDLEGAHSEFTKAIEQDPKLLNAHYLR